MAELSKNMRLKKMFYTVIHCFFFLLDC